MRVAVIVVFVSVLTTPSEAASKSCMSKAEARQHFGSVHLYWHGPEHCWDATTTRRHHQVHDATPTRHHHQIHKVQQKIDQPRWHEAMSEMLPDEQPVQTPWVDRWVDVEPSPIVSRRVGIVQVAPPPIIRDPEPMVAPPVLIVIITIGLTLAIVEVLFGGTGLAGHTHRLRLGARP
jgi:hypothetical protein